MRFPSPLTASLFVALALACGPTDPEEECPVARDADGDGVVAVECGGTDCDDRDSSRYPGATEICDAENVDEDCDPITLGDRDADGDGHHDQICCNHQPSGELRCGNDCDDRERTVNPGAPEVCDGVDNNCNGAIDDLVTVPLFVDADRDGFGAGAAVLVCAGTQGYSTLGNDCDDKQVGIYPGMMRCTPKGNEYELCRADGTFELGYCQNQRICVTQPGGWGTCQMQ